MKEADVCVEAVEDATARHGRPGIVDIDQGPQITSHAFTGVPPEAGIAIGRSA